MNTLAKETNCSKLIAFLLLNRYFLEQRVTIFFLFLMLLGSFIITVAALEVPLLDPMVGREAVDDLLESGEDDDEGDEHGAHDAV